MEDSSKARTFLFNILLILTLLFIYLLFFPKNSYIKAKYESLDPKAEETFNSNINNMKIASTKYFIDKKESKVTLEELINNNLVTELKDSNDELCSKDSYVEKKEDGLLINLECNDKKEKKEVKFDNKEGSNCIYEYKKETIGYTEWSKWSDWQKEEIKKDDFTNVEKKTESEPDGKETVEKTKEYSIEATYNETSVCPSGYTEANGSCKYVTTGNSFDASVLYTCPTGYYREGTKCYGSNTINAAVHYYCPANNGNIEFQLSGTKCNTVYTNYTSKKEKQVYYTCPNGYTLSGDRCYAYETYNEEVEKTKDVKYYRYQKREKKESTYEIIWSTKDNQELISKEYNMSRVIICEDSNLTNQ